MISLTQELHQHLEHKEQLDLMVLNFSKAFDKVPHQCLIYYGKTVEPRDARVYPCLDLVLFVGPILKGVIDRETLDWVSIELGVPQGTTFGQVLFLVLIMLL